MQIGAGKTRFWRFASFGRAGRAAILTAAVGGCASARPEVVFPAPRPPAPDIAEPSTERAEEIEAGLKSVVTGTIGFLPRGSAPVDIGTTVVSLRPTSASASNIRGGPTLRISSATPEFSPPASIVRPGQDVVLRNEGPLVHRLFTARREGDVLRLEPGGTSGPLAFRDRGPVRFYCSLHADETFVLFVEDAPYVTVVSKEGAYDFGRVSPGRYTLAIWSERISGPVRELFVDGVGRATEPIWLVTALIER